MNLFIPLIAFAIISGTAASASTVSNVVLSARDARAGSGIDGSCAEGPGQRAANYAVFTGANDGCFTQAEARAGGGFVAATASETLFSGSGNTRHGSSASASATYFFNLGVTDDYVYNGPERVTINLDYSATASSIFSDPQPNLFTTGASSLVSGFASLTGSRNNIDLQTDRKTFNVSSSVSRDDAGPDFDQEVIVGGRGISLSIVTDPRRTLSLTMSIAASVNVVGPNSARVSALANGGQTLNFASDRPVFEVSDGLLFDFESVNIFNNRWVDPRDTGAGPSTVPLPASVLLLFAGLGALGLMRRQT